MVFRSVFRVSLLLPRALPSTFCPPHFHHTMASPNPFTPNPEMRAIRRSGLHPVIFRALGPSPQTDDDDFGRVTYDPRLPLPSPSDAAGILAFVGLNETTAANVIERAESKYPTLPPSTKAITIPYTDRASVDFPLTRALCDVYNTTVPITGQDQSCADTYEGYVAVALRQGLQPEFAVSVGIHPEDPRYGGDKKQTWYDVRSPDDIVLDMVDMNMHILMHLWEQKLDMEGAVGVEGTDL